MRGEELANRQDRTSRHEGLRRTENLLRALEEGVPPMQRMLDEVRREVTRLLEQEADAARDEEVAALRREVAQLREALASRAVIERAKGFLMHERGIDEGQAYDRLNDLAQRHRRKVRDVAAEITAQPVGQQVASAAARTNGVVVTPS